MINYNKELRLLYQFRESVRQSNKEYQEIETENGVIKIPTKIVKKTLRSTIEHYKSKINEGSKHE